MISPTVPATTTTALAASTPYRSPVSLVLPLDVIQPPCVSTIDNRVSASPLLAENPLRLAAMSGVASVDDKHGERQRYDGVRRADE